MNSLNTFEILFSPHRLNSASSIVTDSTVYHRYKSMLPSVQGRIQDFLKGSSGVVQRFLIFASLLTFIMYKGMGGSLC